MLNTALPAMPVLTVGMSPDPSWLGVMPGGGYSLEYSSSVLNTVLSPYPS